MVAEDAGHPGGSGRCCCRCVLVVSVSTGAEEEDYDEARRKRDGIVKVAKWGRAILLHTHGW